MLFLFMYILEPGRHSLPLFETVDENSPSPFFRPSLNLSSTKKSENSSNGGLQSHGSEPFLHSNFRSHVEETYLPNLFPLLGEQNTTQLF